MEDRDTTLSKRNAPEVAAPPRPRGQQRVDRAHVPAPMVGGCRFVVCEDFETMSRTAADMMADEIRAKRDLAISLATGDSPTRCYQLLAARRAEDPELFSEVRFVKLDEWGGLQPNDPATCEYYLRKHMIGPLGIPDERFIAFHSNPPDDQAECDRVRGELERLGVIDLCVLGLGMNGHLGFNEPADSLRQIPHAAALSKTAMSHSMLDDADQPQAVRCGLTLGMGNIMHAGKVMLLVTGSHKRPAMRQFLARRITARFPASMLWMHREVWCICDADCVEGLDVSWTRAGGIDEMGLYQLD
ncbi:MAG: 6-phosphogluconolactonase [Candidatus Nealsonbacteria bacterium]|nr:6-phosphogluconolactonase [Candidatus Nealsonbacteria bacterium]